MSDQRASSEDTSPAHRVLISTSPDYLEAAFYQLRQALPGAAFERVGPDSGLVSKPDIAIDAVAGLCRSNRVVFIRHLAQIQSEIEIPQGTVPLDRIIKNVEHALGEPPTDQDDRRVSLQLWTSGYEPVSGAERPDLVRKQLASRLSEVGWEIRRFGSPLVCSVLLANRRVYLGCNRHGGALVDWPGGHIGLAKSPERISRSEFKLEELFQIYDLELSSHGTALDLGASPGGWTRVMRQRGFQVTAVDPAPLDSRLRSDPQVDYVASTVGEYLASSRSRFDIMLNDMRMPADLSIEMMLRGRRLLGPGGTLIMTLKLAAGDTPEYAVRTVERSLKRLNERFDILFARQLFHNRHEVTVVARIRD